MVVVVVVVVVSELTYLNRGDTRGKDQTRIIGMRHHKSTKKTSAHTLTMIPTG